MKIIDFYFFISTNSCCCLSISLFNAEIRLVKSIFNLSNLFVSVAMFFIWLLLKITKFWIFSFFFFLWSQASHLRQSRPAGRARDQESSFQGCLSQSSNFSASSCSLCSHRSFFAAFLCSRGKRRIRRRFQETLISGHLRNRGLWNAQQFSCLASNSALFLFAHIHRQKLSYFRRKFQRLVRYNLVDQFLSHF